jgi:hypothetical protein
VAKLVGGGALGDAAHNGVELGEAAMGARENGAGEQVKDVPAVLTLVVQQRGAVGGLDGKPVAGAAARATATLGPKDGLEPAVAGHGVQQFGEGKDDRHGDHLHLQNLVREAFDVITINNCKRIVVLRQP